MQVKNVLTLLFCISSILAKAQIKKGSFLVGGSMGYGSQNINNPGSPENSSSNVNFNPRVSYAVTDNSTLGLKASLYYTSSSASSITSTSLHSGGSLFYRIFFPIKNKLGWYTEALIGIGKSVFKNKSQVPALESRGSYYTLSAIPGLYYQALPKLLINADFGGLYYTHNKYRNSIGNQTGRSDSFGIGLFSGFTIGIDFIIGKP